MVELFGIAASPGIEIGKVFLLDQEDFSIIPRTIQDNEIDDEINRFKEGIEKTKKELENIKEKIANEIGKEHANIFAAHILILEDKTLIDDVIETMRGCKLNIEYIFSEAANNLIRIISSIEDPILRERSNDIRDVTNKVLRNLIGRERETLANLKGEVIVFAKDLAPSDTAVMQKERVIAFVTDIGGKTSHTTIMARALGIPAVVGLKNITEKVHEGDLVIVDGNRGIVIIDPDIDTLNNYTSEKERFIKFEVELQILKDLSAKTKDGYQIGLYANIEIPTEIDLVKKHGADGIGLYRTEFLYLGRDNFPSEDEQFEAYKYVAENMNSKPVVIRTLDLGGDKFLSHLGIEKEMNPFLGLRAIRLCLAKPDIFKTQLKAILRASALGGNLKIMFPFISRIEELRKAKAILNEAKEELIKENKQFDKNIKVGTMIEIPSAALSADILARESDFFSIGTNDLIQYTFAVDRVNESIAYLYDPAQPSIIRLIKHIVEAGHSANIPVYMCGEMAGDSIFTSLLLGLGIDELSMASFSIPEIKKIIRSTTIAEAKEYSKNILSLNTSDEIKKFVFETIRKKSPASLRFLGSGLASAEGRTSAI